MTHATDALLYAITLTSIYVALWYEAIPTPKVFHDDILPVIPWWALVAYGCYALGSLGYGVYTLEDKPEKYEELLSEIVEAKEYLKKNGVDVSE